MLEDFPLRGHTVSLVVKRRKWTIKEIQKVVSRNWDLVAKGTRKTHEFVSFLKDINESTLISDLFINRAIF